MRDLLYKWRSVTIVNNGNGSFLVTYKDGSTQTLFSNTSSTCDTITNNNNGSWTVNFAAGGSITLYETSTVDSGSGSWLLTFINNTTLTLYNVGAIDNQDGTISLIQNTVGLKTVYDQGVEDDGGGLWSVYTDTVYQRRLYSVGAVNNNNGTWNVVDNNVFVRILYETSGPSAADPRLEVANIPTMADLEPPDYGPFILATNPSTFVMDDFLFLAPPVNVTAPVVSANNISPRIGTVLTTTDGTWTGAVTYSYQWRRIGPAFDQPISSATLSTYTMVAADIQYQIRCVVTATGPGGPASANSNLLASHFQPILAFDPTAWIFTHTQGITALVGSPMPDWVTIDNQATLAQTSTPSQPTRLAGGVSFDGSDDHMIYDAGSSRGNTAYTASLVLDSVTNDGVNTERTWVSFGATTSGGNTLQTRVSYSRPDAPNGTRQRLLMDDGSSNAAISLSGYSPGANDINFIVSVGAASTTSTARELDSSTTLIGTATRPGAAMTQDYFTVGARRVAGGPSIANYAFGTLGSVIIGSFAYSSAQALIVRNCLVAEGLI